jgi:choline kinase
VTADGGLVGVVLAAGEGRRLRPLTDTIPKALAPVDGDTTILDIALRNLAAAGIDDVGIVTGYAAEAIEKRQAELEDRHGVALSLIFNDKASIWNNAYSLWLARDRLERGALVVNGDTVHPVSVEHKMLSERGPDIMIALDDRKALAEEEMKVYLDERGALARINKALDPARADGEYIGLTLVEARAAAGLAGALEATFRRDTTLYYEDGFQEFADRGGIIGTCRIGGTDWVEVDNHDDLARAREVACRY